MRHYRVYYPVRIHLIQHMVSAMQRLGFTANVSNEPTALDRVVQTLDTSIHRTNLYPADKCKRNQLGYPPDQNFPVDSVVRFLNNWALMYYSTIKKVIY